jgi:hypothetical protein
MSTLKVVTLQNPASGVANVTLDAAGTTTLGGVVVFDSAQTFPNAVSSLTAGTGLTGGTVTTTGTFALDTTYTDTLYLSLVGGTMTGDITFAVTQTFPNVLDLAGGTMTGDITFAATQTFPAQDLQTVTTAGASTTDTVDVGGLVAAGLTYPTADGTANQVLATDGAGTLGWASTLTAVTAPTVSADPGNDNEVAFDATGNFYFYKGGQWWKVVGASF